MRFFPQNAPVQLEFDKVLALLREHCRTDFALRRTDDLRVHTRLDLIQLHLDQTAEFHTLIGGGFSFPANPVLNLHKELRLLTIDGAVLTGEDWLRIRSLLLATDTLFRWYDRERQAAFPALYALLHSLRYDKSLVETINTVIDERGEVLDSASEELREVRQALYRKRTELRRTFDKLVARMNRDGYLADIEESYLNGRRVLAVHSEQKRVVRGIIHGESDSRRTSFIEPEDTVDLNNAVFELEGRERREVQRLLRELTRRMAPHAPVLEGYHTVWGELDFAHAKAQLAQRMKAHRPQLTDAPGIRLINAYHPLLLLYHERTEKKTIPANLTLDGNQRIIVISGPNAGGKTVTMKTAGLMQVMVQSGLMVPASPDSSFGVFKQLMIHIGDTQSLEYELSTYSSHLMSMKEFMESANGRTLFFIDELGSGSDPALGGAFAEVILEELAHKKAQGIVTTHYLNLKVMAGKTKGIVNAAMGFDEQTLLPEYRLHIGKPGSSYTFAIAERIGLPRRFIDRARSLVDESHFRLDKLLNQTEQTLRDVTRREAELKKLTAENERLRHELTHKLDKEKHRQQVELLKEQNRLAEEKWTQLKDMERRTRALVSEWKRTDDKDKAVRDMAAILFPKAEKAVVSKKRKQIDAKWEETDESIVVGATVKLRQNMQIGEVLEMRGKRAVVKIGQLPMQVDVEKLVRIRKRTEGRAE